MKYNKYMWFIRILLLIIIFLGGVYVGNVYVPQRDVVSAVSVAIPPLDNHGIDLNGYTSAAAQKTLSDMQAVLTADTAHFPATLSDGWFKTLNITFAVQDYNVARAQYEAEIAKTRVNAAPTPQYASDSKNYYAAKKTLEQYLAAQKAKDDAAAAAAQAASATLAAQQAAAAQAAALAAQTAASTQTATMSLQPGAAASSVQPQASSPSVTAPALITPPAASTQTVSVSTPYASAPAQK